MGKGLLAWWRRRIVARGLAGAALFAVPVAVAALIGFGSGFSGVAGGTLRPITSGPDAVPASAQTGPTKLNRAVVALASRQTGSNGSAPSGTQRRRRLERAAPRDDQPAATARSGPARVVRAARRPQRSTRRPLPDVSLPGSGGGTGGAVSGATNAVNGTVNNVLGGVNNTVNGLLGGSSSGDARVRESATR